MLTVTLPIEQWHVIGAALNELPAKTSMGLILELDRQLQLQAMPAEPAVEVKEGACAADETFGRPKP